MTLSNTQTNQIRSNRKRLTVSVSNLSTFWIFFAIGIPSQILGISTTNSLIIVTTITLGMFVLYSKKTKAGLILALLAFIAIQLLALSVQTSPISTKDFLEISKPLFWVSAFLIGKRIEPHNKNFLFSLFVTLAFVELAISTLIYFPSLFWVADLFKGRPSEGVLFHHFSRFTGTFAFPVECGLFLVLAILYNIERYILAPKPTIALTISILLLGLLLTHSRAALILFILAFSVLATRFFKRRTMLFVIAFISILLPIVISQYAENFEYLVASGINILEDGSFLYRIRELSITLEQLDANFIFGSGPSNLYYSTNFGPIESQILSIIGRYGALGGIAFYFLMMMFFTRRSATTGHISISSFFLISITIGAISVSIVEQTKFALIILSALGYISNSSVRGINT